MHTRTTPIKSILICEKCKSKCISYMTDADENIIETYTTLSEFKNGRQEDYENFDYTETVKCLKCGNEVNRRRKKR